MGAQPGEDFIAFCEFRLAVSDGGRGGHRDGLLKVSRVVAEEDAGHAEGMLRLTFVIDVPEGDAALTEVQELFGALEKPVGSGENEQFMTAREVALEMTTGQTWVVTEVRVPFSTREGGEYETLTDFILPFIAMRLPVGFGDIIWMEEEDELAKESFLDRLVGFFTR